MLFRIGRSKYPAWRLAVDTRYCWPRVTTRYGPSVLLTINLDTSDTVRVFLPTRYSNVITDDDMTTINTRQVQLHLIYKETCKNTHSYMLQLVS
jgi:hypothetical protein